jgi:hypothetical protein
MKKKICESSGCLQIAEYLDPMENNICSDCAQSGVETGEFTWEECEPVDNKWSDR